MGEKEVPTKCRCETVGHDILLMPENCGMVHGNKIRQAYIVTVNRVDFCSVECWQRTYVK